VIKSSLGFEQICEITDCRMSEMTIKSALCLWAAWATLIVFWALKTIYVGPLKIILDFRFFFFFFFFFLITTGE
jgi:hypothetical protein